MTDGIQCPWNKNEHGPAHKKLWCLVFHDDNDFASKAPENGFRFCKQLCQYGRNPEYSRRVRDSQEKFKLRQLAARSFARKIDAMRSWIQKPIQGRKVA